MRDAVLLGIQHLRSRAKREKRVLVVITDGEDNSSIATPAAADRGRAPEQRDRLRNRAARRRSSRRARRGRESVSRN